jgi:hypothetical protein
MRQLSQTNNSPPGIGGELKRSTLLFEMCYIFFAASELSGSETLRST